MDVNFDKFHQETKAVVPSDVTNSTKPFYWAAVLNHDKTPHGNNAQDDYLWVKCSKRTSVSQIHDQYKKKLPVDCVSLLRHRGHIPEPEYTLKSLDWYKDRLVAFEVILENDERLRRTRSPLRPRSVNMLRNQEDIGGQQPVSSPLNSDSGRSSSASASPHPSSVKVEQESALPQPTIQSHSPYGQNVTQPPARSQLQLHDADNFQEPLHQPGLPPFASTFVQQAPYPQAPTPLVPFPATSQSFVGCTESHQSTGSIPNQSSPTEPSTLSPSQRIIGLNATGWIRHSALDSIIDQAWDVWQKVEAKERKEFEHKAAQKIGGDTPWSAEDVSQAWSNAKPEAAETESQKEDEEMKVEMDFDDDFGPVEEEGLSSQSQIQRLKTFQLQEILADASIDELEATVEKAVTWLDHLKGPLLVKAEESSEAAQWLDHIGRLQAQAGRTKTVIGVVGDTGAGKSSVINALLDEERLLPTNTMRACTAVVTELSYNSSPDYAYRAEVEFINIEDWKKELTILFNDLIDENGNVSRDATKEDSDASTAYAKIKAVYPKLTKEQIAESSIEALLADVASILGKTRTIEHDDSFIFYKRLQQYVDSKEKATKKEKSKDKKEPKEREFWPLIKVVRLFTKSKCLRNGAILVDLPGVQDANTARARVAEGYMKQCSALWIVALIIRAVDSAAAKRLLGDSFKRQLKMDRGLAMVTFICSKTDDISLMEASESLGLEDVNGPQWDAIDEHRKTQEQLRAKLNDVKETKEVYAEILSDCGNQREIWLDLSEKVKDGGTVYAPRTKKRKARNDKGYARKRKHFDNDDDDFIVDEDQSEEESESEESEIDEPDVGGGQPLTAHQIAAKLAELKETRKETLGRRGDLDAQIKSIKEGIAAAKSSEQTATAAIAQACILGRNEYSRGAIQQDFAAGIKDLDNEIAAEEDEENFDPETDLRDYEALAKSLPVFCVSSRAYQKISGRFRKDPDVAGFVTTEQTEIPALQAHCEQSTVAGRTSSCNRFITSLSQLINSLTLWGSSDGSGAHLTQEQREKEARVLDKSLRGLESALEKLIYKTSKELGEELSTNIFDNFPLAVNDASQQAPVICSRWARPVNRQNPPEGGFYWSSYKAICRRNGVYTNFQGSHNFNEDLSSPMMKHLASGWERTFSRKTVAVLAGLVRNSSKLLQTFHNDVAKRADVTGVGVVGIATLEHQLKNYENIFANMSATAKQTLDETQRDINRDFVPNVADMMTDAYTACVDERGPGSFLRMKTHMREHIENSRNTMFASSCEKVQKRLKKLQSVVREQMENLSDEIFVAINRDYKSVLGGGDLKEGEVMPKWQRDMRRAILHVVNGAEQYFTSDADENLSGDYDAQGITSAVKVEPDTEMDDPILTVPAARTDLPSLDGASNDVVESNTLETANQGLEQAEVQRATKASSTASDENILNPSTVETQEKCFEADEVGKFTDSLEEAATLNGHQSPGNRKTFEGPEDSGVGFDTS